MDLIIIRGDSGSGKTTIAKALHNELGEDALLLSQDVVRREMLQVHDRPGKFGDNTYPANCIIWFGALSVCHTRRYIKQR